MKPDMSLATKPFFYLGLLLIILAVFSVQLGLYSRINSLFFPSSNNPAGSSNPNYLTISTLINYGNATSAWHNKTDVPLGWNFYQLTTTIARVDAYASPAVQNEHYVRAIDGVKEGAGYYWTLWIFCQSKAAWAPSPVGADFIKLGNNQILAWDFQAPSSIDPSTWQPPVAGAAKVSMCS